MAGIDFDPSKLRAIRKRLDLTQAVFAKAAGVSQSLIAKVEAGQIDPTLSNARKIAEAIERLSMQKEHRAEEIMTRDVVSARPSDIVIDLVHAMGRRGISQIPVIEGHRVIGLVSEACLLESGTKKPASDTRVREVMTEPVPTVSPATPVSAVTGLLRYFPAVLVLREGTVQGIITKSDVIKSILK